MFYYFFLKVSFIVESNAFVFLLTMESIFLLVSFIVLSKSFSICLFNLELGSFNSLAHCFISQVKNARITNMNIKQPTALKNPFFTSSPSFIPKIYKIGGSL